jgi:hypothetical protein
VRYAVVVAEQEGDIVGGRGVLLDERPAAGVSGSATETLATGRERHGAGRVPSTGGCRMNLLDALPAASG